MEYFAYKQKEFVYKYIVMLSDTDQFKHMSFANYLKLMFLATDALFLGCFASDFLELYRLKMLSARMQFKRQSSAGDSILIKVNSTNITNTQFTLFYTFVLDGSGELVGLGRQCYDFINKKDNKKELLTETVKAVLTPIAVEENNLLYKY